MIKAVIFDFDMTLIDSSPAMLASFDKICRAFNRPAVTRSRLMGVIGLHDQAFWEATIGELLPEMVDFYEKECEPFEADLFVPFEGSRRVLDRLRERGFKLAVATNRANVATVLERVGLAPLFDCVVTSSMVSRPKPAPDMLLLALDRLQVAVDEAVYVGDTPIDLQAGRAAGLRTVALQTSTPKEELLRFAPREVCENWLKLGDLLLEGEL